MQDLEVLKWVNETLAKAIKRRTSPEGLSLLLQVGIIAMENLTNSRAPGGDCSHRALTTYRVIKHLLGAGLLQKPPLHAALSRAKNPH